MHDKMRNIFNELQEMENNLFEIEMANVLCE